MDVQLDQPVNMHVSFYMANVYGYPSIVATHVSKEGNSPSCNFGLPEWPQAIPSETKGPYAV